MRELERKQRIKRRLYSTPALVGLFLLAVLLGRGSFLVLEKRSESVRHLEELETKVSMLKSREKELAEDIQKLKTVEGINEEIKEKFSVSLEGERVAIIVDEKRRGAATSSEDAPWYEDFWNTLQGLWQ